MTLMIVVALNGTTVGCSANHQASKSPIYHSSTTQAIRTNPLQTILSYSDNAPPAVQRIIKATNSAPYIRAIATNLKPIATNLKPKLEVEAVTRRQTVATFTNGGLENIQVGFDFWRPSGSLTGSKPCYLETKIDTIATIDNTIFPIMKNTHYVVTFKGNLTIIAWHWEQIQGHGSQRMIENSSSGIITANTQHRIITAVVDGDLGGPRYALTYPAGFSLPRHPPSHPVCYVPPQPAT